MKNTILIGCSLVLFAVAPPIMAQESNPEQNVRGRFDNVGGRINDILFFPYHTGLEL